MASPSETQSVASLRAALAALPEPWIALASRRACGADGPPWVRYVLLHPAKGVALVDLDPTEAAVAPLEDFLWHTGFAVLRGDGLPIIGVTVTPDANVAVLDQIEAAFIGSRCRVTNPGWCEAVVDLLLATPNLMLDRLYRPAVIATVPGEGTVPAPALRSVRPDSALQSPADLAARDGDHADALATVANRPATAPAARSWRSWPTSPVTVVTVLLALGTVALVSHEASPPRREAAPPAAVRSIAFSDTSTQPTATVPLRPASDEATATTLPSPATVAGPPADVDWVPVPPPVAAPKSGAPPRRTVVRDARRQAPHVAPPPAVATPPRYPTPHVSVACADVLHPDRPGGWEYHGPPVPGCLPIRFFGFIGMR